MRFDVDLHRQTIKLPGRLGSGKALEMSVVDVGPQHGDRYTAPTIVCIHGFGGRAAHWEYQLEQFQTDYRVIALDLRGHGYTDAPTESQGARYDVPELVGDIDAALKVLQVPERFILLSHSFGGALASYFIRQFPHRVTALIVIASAVRFQLRTLGRLLLRVPPAILTWLRKPLPYVGLNAARLYPAAHVVYLQNKNSFATWDGTEYLRSINTPTLVILGQRDILFSDASYKEVSKLIPGAEQVVIPVSAHQVMVERPDAVNRAIERFLQSLSDPVAVAEAKAAQKTIRRAARKVLEAERPWLRFYDTRTPYRVKTPTVTLPRVLEATARRFAKTVALDYLGRKMNWSEVEKLANRFAHGLLGHQIQPGERILLALPNIPQWVIAYFGILKVGAVAVLCDADAAPETLIERIAENDAKLLLVSASRYHELRESVYAEARAATLRQIVFCSQIEYMGWREKLKFASSNAFCKEVRWPWFQQAKNNASRERRFSRFNQMLALGRIFPPDSAQSVEDVALISYTHGVAERAVPVPLTHLNLAANALQLRHWMPEARPGDERLLAQQPLSTTYGLTGLLHLGMYLGGTLILLPDSDVSQLLKAVKKARPTYFPTTPRMVRQLTHASGVRRYGLASIRICAVSGSSLPQEIREEFEKITRGRLIEAYGLTEASPAVLAMPVAARRQAGVVGLPLPDTEIRILDLDSGALADTDAMGELWVRGPQVFHGYGGKTGSYDHLTAQRLRDGWLATGDVASMDEDGFVTIVDRKDNMLIRGGLRVFPRQLENVLFEHPAVAYAQVRPHAADGSTVQLNAHVLLHRNTQVTIAELQLYCSKRLHPSALPDSITLEYPDASTPR